MWRNWSEEWERRKSYLVRSLFEDIPILSPIAEINETSDDLAFRASSPLPELIIEKYKNRHDEPDEYYRILEAKMIKLYKKLFHELNYESDDDSSIETYKLIGCDGDNENNDSVLEKNISEDHCTRLDSDQVSSSYNSDISDTSELNEDVVPEISIGSLESDGTVEVEISTSSTHEIIVTNAIVHREFQNGGREDINNNIPTEEHSSPTERSLILVSTWKKVDFLASTKNLQQKQVSDRLVDTQAKIDEDIIEANINVEVEEDQIEAMRLGMSKTKSLGSIQEESMLSKESVTPTAQFERQMSLIENSESLTGTDSTSDLTKGMDRVDPPLHSSSSDYSFTKRTGSSICSTVTEGSPNKRKRYESIAIQTSPFTTPTHWENVHRNFFRSTPLIYNLCLCRGHECQ